MSIPCPRLGVEFLGLEAVVIGGCAALEGKIAKGIKFIALGDYA